MDVFHQEPPRSVSVELREDLLHSMWRKSYLGLSAIGVFTIVFNILRLATAIYALNVLDRVVSSGSLETLLMLTVMVLVAVVAATLLNIIRRVMLVRWGSWIERQLGPRMVAMGIASASHSPSSLLRDVARLRNFVGGTGLIAWIDVIFAPMFFVGVFLISPAMGLIVLIASSLVVVLGVANELVTRPSRLGALAAGIDNNEWISSAERNRETVGSLSMGSSFAELWLRSASDRLDESDRTRRINIFFSSAARLVNRCLRIAVLGFGVWLVIEGNLTIGAVIASYYVGRVGFTLTQQATQKWREMILARQSYARMKSALEGQQPAQVSIGRTDVAVPLTFDHVSFRYPKQFTSTFRNINLTVSPGEALYVIGPSEIGKSTFARLAAGVMVPRSGQALSGQVRLGDVTVHRLIEAGQGERVGYLPQHIQLFNGTIRENIARMTSGDMELVIQAAKLVGVHDFVVQLPSGYDTVISEDEPLLSAGRKKTVALARAFYGWPSLVVLDEPEPHLDRHQRSLLTAAIRTLKAHGSIVVVTTQLKPPMRNIATKVLMLEKGKTTLIEDPAEIAALRRPKTASSPASDGSQ